jgi:hypothetical protein
MPTFGKRSNERPASGANGNFELYLKTFKDPQTRIRILEDNPETWTEYKEHFDKSLKISFPCAKHEGADACIGCDYPVEHPEWSDTETHFPGLTYAQARDERKRQDPGWGVRDASSKWVFPAIDPKGFVSVYKIGYNLWDAFKNQYGVLKSVTGTEFVVVRSGTSFNDTNYTPTAVPGQVREPKAAVPTEQVISDVLGNKYSFAMEKYGFEPGEDVPAQPDPAPVVPSDEAQATPPPAKTGDLAADELAARRAAAPDTGPVVEPGDSPAHGFIPREASTGEIKDWLAALDPPVEFNPKAARGVLVGLAEKAMTERQIANF